MLQLQKRDNKIAIEQYNKNIILSAYQYIRDCIRTETTAEHYYYHNNKLNTFHIL